MTDHQIILIIAGLVAVVTSTVWFPLLVLAITGIIGLVFAGLLCFLAIIETYFGR